MKSIELTASEKSEVIEMALSDHVTFENIFELYGLREKHTKKLMRKAISHRSYKNWRRRVRLFSDRRECYK